MREVRPEEEEESLRERVTRNWNELLQELRVAQTGVQIMTGFLLTVPFSARFEDLDAFQRDVYLAILSGSVLTTGFVMAPVAFHRVLFRQGMKEWLVNAANTCARIGMAMLALTSSGAVFLVFDVVTERWLGWTALVVGLLFFTALWGAAPQFADRRGEAGDP